MRYYAIYGAGGCGRDAISFAKKQISILGEEYQLVFIDDNKSSNLINGYPVLSYDEWIDASSELRWINIAISDHNIREKIVRRCECDHIKFFSIKASNVIELECIEIGEGAILAPFVTLASNVKIGKHFHANLYSYVEHDCIIGDFVTFAPGVQCNGNVIIEDYAYIGAGAILKQGTAQKPLVIGCGAIIGMGSVVTKNVNAGDTVIGNPAKVMIKKVPS